MTEIIRHLLTELVRAQARGLGGTAAEKEAEVAVRAQYGGERVYIAGLPKQRRAVQLAHLEKRTTQEIVAVTGLSRQHVWRMRKLSR